ncbi:hypothetical protein B0H14DRAFT_3477601 [Mycena olivaceomarginata]|nr:hypothetical protein B0H14DRAFT_3477601 [Mycena olivaceomarginata]
MEGTLSSLRQSYQVPTSCLLGSLARSRTVFKLASSLCFLCSGYLGLPERATPGHTNGPTLKRARWRTPFIACRTRSGAQWSPWELDELPPDPSLAPPRVQIVRARVSLAPYLHDTMDAAEQRATVHDAVEGEEDDGWEDEDPVLSRSPTPISRPLTPLPLTWSRSPSPLSDLPPSPSWSSSNSPPSLPPTASSPPNICSPVDAPAPTISRRKERQATGKKARRQRHWVAQAKAAGFGPAPKLRHSQDYRQEEAYRTTCHAARDFPSSATGNWTGPRASKKARLTRQQARFWLRLSPQSFASPNCLHRDPKLILDADSRIVAVLLGRPEGDNWDEVLDEMVRVMDGVRARRVKRGVFKRQECRHCRGDFYVLKGGLTKGPGQKKPGNLALCKEYRRLLGLITDHPAIRRIAGFQSRPGHIIMLYRHYKLTMQSIFERQPELTQLFPNSIFPTATFNLGPDVITPEHLDMLNYAYGMCAVTSAGKFNHKLGGHIYLEHLKLVCEFPSGASVLLFSGALKR